MEVEEIQRFEKIETILERSIEETIQKTLRKD
jgi:hypothetical protein